MKGKNNPWLKFQNNFCDKLENKNYLQLNWSDASYLVFKSWLNSSKGINIINKTKTCIITLLSKINVWHISTEINDINVKTKRCERRAREDLWWQIEICEAETSNRACHHLQTTAWAENSLPSNLCERMMWSTVIKALQPSINRLRWLPMTSVSASLPVSVFLAFSLSPPAAVTRGAASQFQSLELSLV